MDELRFYKSRTLPRKALNKAVANKEETTELLLEEFDAFLENPAIVLSDQDYMLHIYGIYLLAQFRVTEAFPKLIEFISWPEETIDFTLGDIVTEDLNSILYSTFNGDFEQLKVVIENPAIAFYVRDAALDTYAQLYADGHVSQEEFFAYLRKIIADKRFMGRQDISEIIQSVVMAHHLFEMLDDMQALYDEGRMDTQLAGEYDEFLDFVYDYKNNRQSVTLIDDAIEELQSWGMFDPLEELNREMEERQLKLENEFLTFEKKNERPQKVGRNDPCPCGSGKKYKKCCLKKDHLYRKKKQEPLAVQTKWLEYYPTMEGESGPGEVRITDHFDEKAIEIDKLVYLALRKRPRPLWEEIDDVKELTAQISYLSEALNLLIKKMADEELESFEAYDRLHKIHYRSYDWVKELEKIIVRNDLVFEYEKLFERTKETLSEFGF